MTSPLNGNTISVASGTSAGAAGGSVINVSQLVSQLVQATQAPQQAIINAKGQTVTTQISAVGTLKGALSSFQSSLAALDSPTAFNAQSASSGSPSVFTATLTSNAPVGSYNVVVSQLATAQQLLSGPFTGTGNSSVGTGTLQFSLGGSSFNIAVTSANNTLNGIAQAIDSAAGNPGITATVLQGTDGAHLLLTSTQTGAANAIQVGETDSGNALAALTIGSGNTAHYSLESPAQDAQFSISGVPGASPGNTVTTALSGVTLHLVGTSPTTTGTSGTTSTPATLTISSNTAAVTSNINSFVSAYNTLVGTFQSLGGFDSATHTAGPLNGNALLSSLQSEIQGSLFGVVKTGSTVYNTLASIGVTANKDGTLSVNNATLGTALSTNFNAVSQLFSGAQGVATNLNTQITANLSTKGAVTSASDTLISQENALTKQTSDLNTQLTALSQSLTQQFSALNTLLSSLQTTSSFLTQAFATLPGVGSNKG